MAVFMSHTCKRASAPVMSFSATTGDHVLPLKHAIQRGRIKDSKVPFTYINLCITCVFQSLHPPPAKLLAAQPSYMYASYIPTSHIIASPTSIGHSITRKPLMCQCWVHTSLTLSTARCEHWSAGPISHLVPCHPRRLRLVPDTSQH